MMRPHVAVRPNPVSTSILSSRGVCACASHPAEWCAGRGYEIGLGRLYRVRRRNVARWARNHTIGDR